MQFQYNQRPVTIAAWTGDNQEEIKLHTRGRVTINADNTITIHTVRGELTAYPGDVIVWDRTIHGAICYPLPAALLDVVFSVR